MAICIDEGRAAAWVVLGFALVAASAPPAAVATHCTPDEICTDPPLVTTDGELAWRYVGRLPLELANAACPTAAGWSASKVFPAGPGEVPLVLKRFCVYTANIPVDPSPPVPAAAGLEQLDRDVMVAATMGPQAELKNIVGGSLREHFLAQASAAAVAPSGNANVVLAVVDTMPGSPTPLDDPVPASAHGHALMHMAEDLACNDNQSNCAIRLSSNLALPWLCTDGPVCRDDIGGGYLGTPVDLAQAAYRELVKWQIGGENGLVINLSLGWDRVFNTRTDGTLRVATQIAQQVLEVVSCRGALVLAAAGNSIAGPDRPNGPLMPAEFARVAAPTRPECLAMLPGEVLPPGDFPPAGTARPLLHAVGAIGADGSPYLARMDGEPELVAFGDHGIAVDRDGEFTATLSGSSTAALVASATIAQVWSYRPGAAGWQIIQAVYDAGTSVPNAAGTGVRTADFCLASPAACDEVHRVTLCEAVLATCVGAGCPTPDALACSAPQNREAVIDRNALTNSFPATADIHFDTPGFVTEVIAQCAPRPGVDYSLVYLAGQRPENPCPHVQYFGTQATPFAGGQPGHTTCEDCPVTFASPGTLYLEVQAQFASADAVLFCAPNNGTMYAYALQALGTMVAPQRFRIDGIDESCAQVGLQLAALPVGLPPDDPATVVTPLLLNTDPDEDGVPAAIDNCLTKANAAQRDTDGDGIGNACDTDLNNNCITNAEDLGLFKAVYFTSDDDADFNGDGIVNVVDLGTLRRLFFTVPGPTADTSLCGP